MLRGITFDLWETLIRDDSSVDERRRSYRVRETRRILAESGIDVSEEVLNQAHANVIHRLELFWGANQDVSILEQTNYFIDMALFAQNPVAVSPATLMEIARHYAEAALPHPPGPDPASQSVLAWARESGLTIGLISNTGRTPGRVLREILARLELRSYIDVFCFSDEMRMRKPAPEMFLRTLGRMAVPPEETVHVGDRVDADVIGAQGAGMRAVHLDRGTGGHLSGTVPDFRVRSLDEIPAILNGLRGGGANAPPARENTQPPRETRPL